MALDHRYCEYRRPVWPWQWVSWWIARRRDRRHPQDRSDGRDYVSWTAVVSVQERGMPSVGTVGRVVSADRQCGELSHRIEFPDHSVSGPLPWPGIELIPPTEDSAPPAPSGRG